MKTKKSPVIYRILAAIVLPFVVIILARVCFGYDVFDHSGWSKTSDGRLCYLDYDGMPVSGWQDIAGKTYYFSPEQNGAMATGWLEIDGERFYLDENGLKTIGWAELDHNRYYFDENGFMHTGWLDANEETFYFNEDGTMHTGWLDIQDGRYYLSEEGIMQTGWMETPEGLCYLSETGAVSSGWVDTEMGRYYIDEDGRIHTGWLEADGRTYFLEENGKVYTGWMNTDEGRYYFQEDGSMAVGKVIIDDTARYFTSTGKYFVLVNRWNPVPDDYEADLVWIDGFQIDSSCYDPLKNMMTACRAAGYPCDLTSAYRGYNYQNTLFQRKVNKLMAQGYTFAAAETETSRSIAIPGTSEHQLGLAVDIKNGYNTYGWLAEHSWEYGFILRYPNGTTSYTGIYYEPWHFRYVGKDLAKEIFDSGLCVEAYMELLTESAE